MQQRSFLKVCRVYFLDALISSYKEQMRGNIHNRIGWVVGVVTWRYLKIEVYKGRGREEGPV